MNLAIDKAKLIKGGEKIEIFYTKTADDGSHSIGSETFDAPMHPDLKQSFEALIIHFGIMTGQIPVKSIKDISNYKEEIIEGFKVSSFSIGGDNEGVTITGTRLLWNGKAFNTNTPYYLFTESEQTRYCFMDDLVEKLARLDEELKKYYQGAKRGADAQLNMFPPDPPVTSLQLAEPEKPVFNDTLGLHDVTEEYIEMNKKRKEKATKIQPADPEAMARVAAEDDDIVIPELKKKGRKKKVAQSAAAPSGEVEEIDE